MIICEIPTKSRKESRTFVHFLLKRNGKCQPNKTDLQRLVKTSETADKTGLGWLFGKLKRGVGSGKGM